MQTILNQLKLKADVIEIQSNGVMSKYFLRLQPGGTVKRIENRANEIALGMKSFSIPLVRIIPEEGLISLEMLTKEIEIVKFDNLTEDLYNSTHDLPIILGKQYTGEPLIADVAKMPHMLIAGTTGSGKSVLLHSILCSLLQQKTKVELALIDPKNVEFTAYQNVKQLLYPVANYADDAHEILSDLVEEMDDRFKLMAKASVNSIQEYNIKKPKKAMPYIVLMIDEFSDLMQLSKKTFQEKLGRLAQKSRACGIHIIIATQRPSADVITGVIKANCPTVVSFRVTSITNSRVVLDRGGAEKLLNKGDGLINSSVYNMLRFKGAFLDPSEVEAICNNHKKSRWSRFINYLRNG